MSQTLRIGIALGKEGGKWGYPGYMLFLDQVVLVSTVPFESDASASSNTYKHTPQNSRPAAKTAASSITAGNESLGQIYQLELGGSETFGVKVTPFTYKDASIPAKCLTSTASENNLLLAYHSTLSAVFIYAEGKDRPVCRSFGHERISVLQATPCGKFLLAGTEAGSLVLWRIGSGDLVTVIEAAHFQALRVIKFSSDGSVFATGASDALIKVWSWTDMIIPNLNRPEPLYTFSQHSAPVTDLVFSLTSIGKGRGRLLSASLDGKCNFYDLVDGQLLLQLTVPAPISSVALNATETTIFAAATDGNIYPFHLNGNNNSSNCTPVIALKFHKGPISALQWSLDERLLISAGFEDGQVAFWDAQSHQLLKSCQLSSKKVSCTNILVSYKSDPILFDNNSAATTTFTPFKRIGNPLTNISTAASILPLASPGTSAQDSSETREMLNELTKENGELRLINSELCSIICELDK